MAEEYSSAGVRLKDLTPSGCQLSPKDAGAFALHASIVHLAGVVVDNEELEPNRRREVLPFHPSAISTTKFASDNLPSLLTGAYAKLQRTQALIYPQTMAA